MKELFKKILPLAAILVMLCSVSVSAAVPAAVTGLKATASDNTIKLTWKKAGNAKGYYIYRVDRTGKQTYFKKTTARSLTLKKCSYNVEYGFQVCAYDSTEKGAFSQAVFVTPKLYAPAAPKNFANTLTGDRSASFSWTRSSKATGYYVQYQDEETGEWVTSLTTSSRKAKISKLKADTTYSFRVIAYRKSGGLTVTSAPSNVVSVDIVKASAEVKGVRGARYKVKVKKDITVTGISPKGSVTLKKGTAITVNAKTGTYVIGYTSNGTVKVPRKSLSYYGLDSSSKNDYSKDIKEDYVNMSGFSSRTNKLIWISHYKLKVNVFTGSKGNWKLVKEFPCCVGKWSTRSPGGLHRILKKIRYGLYGGPYIYWSVGDYGTAADPQGAAFHNKVDGNMSKAVSHGCVRMRHSDLVWLYNNCPTGTTVWSK